jgi:hypothetical protein
MTTEIKENKTAELEITARLADVEIHTKEICDKWLLFTFDLPSTPEGNKARAKFLKDARRLGACQHTESVYLIPFTAAAEMAALELAKAGKLFVWTSESTDRTQAQTVTRNYDQELSGMLKKLGGRVDRMVELLKANKIKTLNRMREKTEEMLSDMGDAVRRRESLDLMITYEAIRRRYQMTGG